MASHHPDFVSLADHCPGLLVEASYATSENFTGEIVPGYKAKVALSARATAEALLQAQAKAKAAGCALKVFDGYRPEKAVRFFQEWANREETNAAVKAKYYPHFSRQELFGKGYIALRSSHSRGGALDLTLHDLATGSDLDMGGIFDFFHELSSTDSPLITRRQQENRNLLRSMMVSSGFRNYHGEWWHYSLVQEQFPHEYFDFDVE